MDCGETDMALNHINSPESSRRAAYRYVHAMSLGNAGLAIIARDVTLFVVVANSDQGFVRSVLDLIGLAWAPLLFILLLPIATRLWIFRSGQRHAAALLHFVVFVQLGVHAACSAHLPYRFVDFRFVVALTALTLTCAVLAEVAIWRSTRRVKPTKA